MRKLRVTKFIKTAILDFRDYRRFFAVKPDNDPFSGLLNLDTYMARCLP
jgi:hypothetical protein